MNYAIETNEGGLVTGWLLGRPQNKFEQAPDGFTPENADDWVKTEGEWLFDPILAEKLRAEGAIDNAKRNAKWRINRAYSTELDAILRDYPDAETKTWDKQESEARAWAVDNTVVTPLLTEIANARGMALADLVPRVIAKADAWMQLSGAATGKRQALEDAIASATIIEELEAIVW